MKTKVQGVYLAAVKLQSCVRSPAWECAVWAGSTAALQHCSWTARTLQLETHGPATWYSWNTHEELTTAVSWAVTLSPLGSYSRYLIAVSLQCGCSLQHCSIWAGPLTANHPSAAAANYANYVAAEPGGALNETSQSFTVLGEGPY